MFRHTRSGNHDFKENWRLPKQRFREIRPTSTSTSTSTSSTGCLAFHAMELTEPRPNITTFSKIRENDRNTAAQMLSWLGRIDQTAASGDAAATAWPPRTAK